MAERVEPERSRSEESGIESMENEGGSTTAAQPQGDELASSLARYGIVSVPATFFEWGGYRYTNASDAIAAAKRGAVA